MPKTILALMALKKALPFCVVGTAGASGMSVTRITEALIIAACSGGIVVYSAQMVLGEKLVAMERSIEHLQTTVEQMQRDIYMPKFEKTK